MKNAFLVTVLMCTHLVNALGQADKPLTNQDIIEMSKAQLPASVIISKIKASAVDFKTEIDDLKILAEQKVPETVVSAMIEAEAAQKNRQPEKPVESRPAVESPVFVPYNQLDKESQKLRLRSPAVVQIVAPASDIMPLILRGLQSWDYQVDDESNKSLLVSKPAKNFGDQLLIGLALGGNNWRYKVQVSIAEFGGTSSLSVRAWVASDNVFGKTNQHQLDDSKKWRAELDDLLLAVKNEAERKLTTSRNQLTKPALSIAPTLSPDGLPIRWKSVTTGIIRSLRRDGDFIYVEAELGPEQREMGLSQLGEFKREGDVYKGKITSPFWFWWKINPVTGKKYAEKVCWVDDDVTLRIASPSRIEIEGEQYPKGTKFDKNCKPNKKKTAHPTSVWIPLEQPS